MARVIEVKLDPHGLPNEWLRVKDPKFMSWAKTKEVLEAFTNPESVDLVKLEELYCFIIESWHVSATDDQTRIFDGTPTREQLQEVPNIVLEVAAVTLKRRMEAQLPPA